LVKVKTSDMKHHIDSTVLVKAKCPQNQTRVARVAEKRRINAGLRGML